MGTEDIPYHIPSAFEIGNRVKIARKTAQVRAWYATWTDEMTNRIGRKFYVVAKDAISGFLCAERRNTTAGWWYHSCALDLAEQENIVIEVPSI
jgi:hypothetical protein